MEDTEEDKEDGREKKDKDENEEKEDEEAVAWAAAVAAASAEGVRWAVEAAVYPPAVQRLAELLAATAQPARQRLLKAACGTVG